MKGDAEDIEIVATLLDSGASLEIQMEVCYLPISLHYFTACMRVSVYVCNRSGCMAGVELD